MFSNSKYLDIFFRILGQKHLRPKFCKNNLGNYRGKPKVDTRGDPLANDKGVGQLSQQITGAKKIDLIYQNELAEHVIGYIK